MVAVEAPTALMVAKGWRSGPKLFLDTGLTVPENSCSGAPNREEGSQGLEARGPKAFLDTGLTVPKNGC
jgi:hypothetical protein